MNVFITPIKVDYSTGLHHISVSGVCTCQFGRINILLTDINNFVSTNDLKVLIVDDSPISVRIVFESLKSLAQLFVATNGEMALSIVKENPPDLILLDIEMPKLNGLEVCKALKYSDQYCHIPIIFVTAELHIESELIALGLGGIDYITKPINTNILRTRIRGHLLSAKRTKELILAKKQLSNLISALPVFISSWSYDTVNVFSNDLQSKWFKLSPNEMSGLSLSALFSPENYQIIEKNIDLAINGTNSVAELSLFVVNKIKRYSHISFISEQIFAGEAGFLMIITDITERKRQELKLQSQKNSVEVTRQSMGDGVISTDTRGKVTFINPVAEKLTAWSKDDAIGQSIESVMNLKDSFTNASMLNPIRTALTERIIVSMNLDTVLVAKDGVKNDVEDSASPILDKQGKMIGAIIVFYDVTEVKKKASQQARFSTQDGLTQLPNRYLLLDRTEQSIKKAKIEKHYCALLMIDIDEFSNINNTYGYLIGDRLIVEISELLQTMLLDSDTLCRPGGDQFTILLPSFNDASHVAELCSRLLAAMDTVWDINGLKFSLTISIGAAIYPNDGLDAATLYRRAGTALRETKQNGRNNYRFFAPEIELALKKQFQGAMQLRNAIENDEISIYYQPKIDAKSRKIAGVEALVRWIQADGTIIYPDYFIPLAEKTNLVIPLGAMVLQKACKQAVIWQKKYPLLSIAVNISAVQFNPVLLDTVKNVIANTGIVPNTLELEITESILINDAHAIDTIKSLKGLGVKLCLDDFGKGYSSLSYIKKFPLDVVKIDQSFVREMLDNYTDLSICETIVALANKLGLDIVAEGVETLAHANKLIEMRCSTLQGYYYSKPIPLEMLSDMLVEYNSSM